MALAGAYAGCLAPRNIRPRLDYKDKNNMPLQIALQMDALSRLNAASDSTLELARAAAESGHRLFHYEPQAMRMDVADGAARIAAFGRELIHAPGTAVPWSHGAEEVRDLAGFDVILMRQDPPFDLAYITATHMLERLPKKVRVVNDPAGVRNAPEKILATHFPHLMPPTLVTRDRKAIESFRDQHKDIIIKPLYGYAGYGIFHLKAGDDNLPALVETLAAQSPEPWMIQKFLPVHETGDTRILMLDGVAVGGVRRMPAANDMRGTLRTGAKAERMDFTERDREICEALGPVLRERGLFLVGIDVIGDYLTEINVTSPTGLIVADRLEGRSGRDRIAEQFWRKMAE
jgi:glutathione synthase